MQHPMDLFGSAHKMRICSGLIFTTLLFLSLDKTGYDIYTGFGSSQGVWAFNEEGDSVLWLGTERGLVRKDLKNSTTRRKFLHDPRDAKSISNDTVFAIVKDKGNFWIGTYNGLNYFNTKTRKIHQVLS